MSENPPARATTSTKECYRCERELPADLRHFRRHGQKDDNLNPTCKECYGVEFGLNRPNQVLDPDDGFRYCPGCLRKLPADEEHFFQSANRQSGFKPNCKECRGTEFGVHDANKVYDSKEGYKICNGCRRELPADKEHFFQSPKTDGFTTRCKECTGGRFGISRPNYGRDDGKWRCATCDTLYDRNEENFYTSGAEERDGRPSDGLMSQCKSCHTKRSNEMRRQAENGVEWDFGHEKWVTIQEHWDSECAYCGSTPETLERDHIIPLSRGGDTVPENIVPACPSCNRSKGPKPIGEWYPEQEFYDKKRAERIQNQEINQPLSDTQ